MSKNNTKPRGYWTKEKCHEVALLCNTKKEFNLLNSSAYAISKNNKWIDEICSHMIQIHKPNGYWTKEICYEVALLCKTKTEFRIKYSNAYDKCLKNKWIDEFCSHMKIIGNLHKRVIYICTFSDNSIYVGLTCNPDRRLSEHIHNCKNKNTAVYKHILKTGLIPDFKVITDYLDVNDAIEMEKYYVDYYKNCQYNILNIDKPGYIGKRTTKKL